MSMRVRGREAADQMRWHQLPAESVLETLKASTQGLGPAEAVRRLAERGPNVLAEGKRRGVPQMVFDQFRDFMILVLLAAALISGLIGLEEARRP